MPVSAWDAVVRRPPNVLVALDEVVESAQGSVGRDSVVHNR